MLGRTVTLALLLSPPLMPLAAQTRAESRLVVGIAMGAIGSADLWSVPNQPITTAGRPTPDVFALKRRLRNNFTASGHVTYFHTPHLGFTGEFGYTGLGTEDSCQQVQSSGAVDIGLICNIIDGGFDGAGNFASRPASSAKAVNLLGGVTFRAASRAIIQPYARALAGFTLLPRNTVGLTSSVSLLGETVVPVYLSDGSSNLRPTGALAIGIATYPSGGSQFRLELRGTWVSLSSVDGPSTQQGLVPPHSSRFVLVPSLVVGFDIVLKTTPRLE